MHNGVQQTEGAHQHSGQFVQIDVLVQREEPGEAPGPEKRDTLSEHQHQDEGTVEVETLSCKKRETKKNKGMCGERVMMGWGTSHEGVLFGAEHNTLTDSVCDTRCARNWRCEERTIRLKLAHV